jgi:HEAT repeat protein
MSDNNEAFDQISQLVEKLADESAVVREKSRESPIQIGTYDVTRALVLALIDPTTHVRWEAAKALQAMSDPVSAPALMNALDDDDEAGAAAVVRAIGIVSPTSLELRQSTDREPTHISITWNPFPTSYTLI